MFQKEGAQILGSLALLPRLASLTVDLHGNSLGNAGARALMELRRSAGLAFLHLDLGRCYLHDEVPPARVLSVCDARRAMRVRQGGPGSGGFRVGVIAWEHSGIEGRHRNLGLSAGHCRCQRHGILWVTRLQVLRPFFIVFFGARVPQKPKFGRTHPCVPCRVLFQRAPARPPVECGPPARGVGEGDRDRGERPGSRFLQML